MKNLLTFSLLSLIFLSGCTKDDVHTGNTVKYVFYCDSCTATMQTANYPNKTIQVSKFYLLAEMNSLKTIDISTTGTGKIKSKIIVNGKTVHEQTNEQTGNTINYSVAVD